jgi:hypothetical protein
MKKRLIIHQPSNYESKNYRYYNIFFDDLIKKISEKHDVILDNFYKDANKGRSLVKLSWPDDSPQTIDMLECEMIITDYDTKETQILSVADDLTPCILNLTRFENVTTILVAQFIRDKIYHHILDENKNKYYPWIYFPFNSFDLEKLYKERKKNKNLIDKLYFKGDTSNRPILNFFNSDILDWGWHIGSFDEYSKELIKYKVALSVSGRGELCYRDIECFALGVPIIRFEYMSELYEPLIPNFHYISVDRPENFNNWMMTDRTGNEYHAQLIIERFEEVKNDKKFLDFISKNAKEYYENNLSPKNSVGLTLKLLKL